MEPTQIVIAALIALISFALGFAVSALKNKQSPAQAVLDVEQLQNETQRLFDELAKAQAQQQQANAEYLRTQAAYESAQQRVLEQKDSIAELTVTVGHLQEDKRALEVEKATINTTLAQRERHFVEQMEQLKHSRTELTKEFENLSHKILAENGQRFKQMNSDTIGSLLIPIQSEIKGFKERVEKIHEKDAEQRIQLRTELEQLQKLNQDITDKAEKLTTALQGQKKLQGNWGELMLENVLDGSGLRLGKDYQREVSLTTDEGVKQRPDVVVYLPQHKHIIIDAKTSLAAYTQYVNADDEITRNEALKAHAKALSDRITELSDRDYYKLPELNSPEIVIMFIPIESAYVEALKYDETLYQRAIEQNVLVATPTTLLTSLNIVRQLWRFEDQNKHTAELANRAEKFYDKLRLFLGSMQDVGKKLDQAKGSYDKALGQLHSGRGNLIKQASEFKELGVAVKNELPAELLERAHLELETFPLHKAETAEAALEK